MDTILSEYQQWKQQGAAIRAQAKQAMEARFRDLLVEAAQLAQDYKDDFGVPLKPPAAVLAFKIKEAPKAAPKKAVTGAPVAPDANPKVVALEKKLAAAKKKLAAAQEAGTPTRNLEDKIYEIEDELRLANAE